MNEKYKDLDMKLDQQTIEKVQECAEHLGISTNEVYLRAIDFLYNQLREAYTGEC